jgi:hypothetical protein
VNSEPVHPLSGDPKRQADPLFRGCEYQVWQTVSAWLRLGPDELLFVEGAEDFDVVASDAAVTTQVKNAVQPVSLRSKDVQDAIRHYWELRTRHSGTRIHLRFLTRATIAEEQDQPFGQGVAGLGLWMRPKLTDEECRKLADFLVTLEKIGADLKQWLQAASPDQICQELIRGITWETSAEAVEYVERTVNRRLAVRGEARGIPPSVTNRISRRLFDEIWKVLRQKTDRFVDRLRLEELFEAETRISVPHAEYQIMLRGLTTKTPGQFVEPFQKGAPPFAGPLAQRSNLVDKIQEQLRSSGFAHLHGSTRMGKTTLAKLVVCASEAQWLWWSAARLPGRDIALALRILTRELDAQSGPISVVLDDLDFTPTTARGFEEALGEMVATIRGRRGRLLITSHKPLPPGFRHPFGLSADQIIAVPALSKEEVAEIATGLGCPSQFCEKWSAIVRANSMGHPHLAAVHLLALQRAQWPAPTIVTLDATIAEVDAERNEARQLLSSLPPEQREALYRLSLFPSTSELARFAIPGLDSLDKNNRAALARHLAWFIYEGRRPGEQLFPRNPALSFLLRRYQFNLAIEARPERAMLGYRCWRMEAALRDLSALERLTISMTVLPYGEVPLPAKEVVLLLGEFAVAMAQKPDWAAQLPTTLDFPKLSYLSDIRDTVSILGLFVCWRCKTIQFLDELLDGLRAAPPELRGRILRGFASNEAHLRLAFSRTWVAEAERETPDWNGCVRVFEKAYQLGLVWGFQELALAAISAIAVVQDEYLHDSVTAHATINRLASAAGLSSHQIDDRRATVYFNEGKFAEALDCWQRALSRWQKPTTPFDQSAAFAARSAGVAAAKLERWEASSAWFLEVQQFFPEPKDEAFLAGALADAAYAHWKAGDSKQAVIVAIEAWRIADSLPALDDDFEVFAVRKTVGHVIAWLHGAITDTGVDNLHEPTAGMCSNPGISEKIRELQPTESAGV